MPDAKSNAGRPLYRAAAVSVVKHEYLAKAVAAHPQFDLVCVADDPQVPDWIHERNQLFADQRGIPYVRNVEDAIRDYHIHVAAVSSEAERHCDLSIRAANLGVHVVQD